MRSCLYSLDPPMPKYLAPAPPVRILVSYEITPPSSKIPAKSSGGILSTFCPLEYSWRVVRIICLSLSRFPMFSLSIGANHLLSSKGLIPEFVNADNDGLLRCRQFFEIFFSSGNFSDNRAGFHSCGRSKKHTTTLKKNQ